jgi:hypothetical protein
MTDCKRQLIGKGSTTTQDVSAIGVNADFLTRKYDIILSYLATKYPATPYLVRKETTIFNGPFLVEDAALCRAGL